MFYRAVVFPVFDFSLYSCTSANTLGQATAAIITANVKCQSLEYYLFESQIFPDDLSAPGSYTLEGKYRTQTGIRTGSIQGYPYRRNEGA